MNILSIFLLVVAITALTISIILICWLVSTLNSIDRNLSFLRIDANNIRALLTDYLCEDEDENEDNE